MRFLFSLFAAGILPLHAAVWFDGGDLSAAGVIEKLGGGFNDRTGRETDAIRALASFGANCVRLRIFVQPDGMGFTNNDLAYTLALAKRAKAVGQTILLDFHYSDTWANPGKQGIPKSWPQDHLEDLVRKIEAHINQSQTCPEVSRAWARW